MRLTELLKAEHEFHPWLGDQTGLMGVGISDGMIVMVATRRLELVRGTEMDPDAVMSPVLVVDAVRQWPLYELAGDVVDMVKGRFDTICNIEGVSNTVLALDVLGSPEGAVLTQGLKKIKSVAPRVMTLRTILDDAQTEMRWDREHEAWTASPIILSGLLASRAVAWHVACSDQIPVDGARAVDMALREAGRGGDGLSPLGRILAWLAELAIGQHIPANFRILSAASRQRAELRGIKIKK
jgi:hypothetical protein